MLFSCIFIPKISSLLSNCPVSSGLYKKSSINIEHMNMHMKEIVQVPSFEVKGLFPIRSLKQT